MDSVEKCIASFRVEMQNVGYVAGEVEAFINDIVEGRKLSNLNQQESKDIIDNLNNYLSFAKKCKNTTQH